MGQILHGSATTTHAVRAAIQRSKAPLKELAARYGLNRKTVAKWRKRTITCLLTFELAESVQQETWTGKPPLASAFHTHDEENCIISFATPADQRCPALAERSRHSLS